MWCSTSMILMQAALQVLLQQMYKPLASEIKFRETMVATKVGVSALTGHEGTRVRKVHGAPEKLMCYMNLI
jgi:hypothetical protein